MARGVSKRGRSLGPVSRQLDERFPISFSIIGTESWLQECFVEGAILPAEKVAVSGSGDVAVVKEWLDKRRFHSGDTETDGVDAHRPESRVVMLQLGNPEHVWIIDPALTPEFKGHLESIQFLHIWQNAIFDFKMLLRKYGVHQNRMYCTMLAEQLLTSGIEGKGVGLEDIARRRPPHRIISKEVRKLFYNLGREKFTREMVYYSARDVALLEPIMLSQVEELKRYQMTTVAQDEFNVIPVTAGMELWGLYLDRSTIELALRYWAAVQHSLEQEILLIYGQRRASAEDAVRYLFPGFYESFNIASQKSKLEALRELGLNIKDTKRDTLEAIDDPITRKLVEYSYVLKITSTYGESLIGRIDPDDHLLHPHFRQLGAGDEGDARKGRDNKSTIATGRYSSDFQQLPRGEKTYAPVTDPVELAQVEELFAVQLAQLRQPQPQPPGELVHV